MKLRERLAELLFPPRCPFCGRVTERSGVCSACAGCLPWTAGEEQRFSLPGGTACAAPLWYEDRAREGLLRYKFGGAAGAAEALGDLLAQCAAEQYAGEFDLVTWVPVGKKRLRRRGYDQARLLAESACRRWETRPLALLRKIQENPAQSGLSGPAARRANVLGVYGAERAKTAGHRILLIDDVVTTGATLAECARTLREAGAAEVVCLALARTRERQPQPGRLGTADVNTGKN